MRVKHVQFTATVGIEVPGAWGRDCTIGQVRLQAEREASKLLRKLQAERRNSPEKVTFTDIQLCRIVLEEE